MRQLTFQGHPVGRDEHGMLDVPALNRRLTRSEAESLGFSWPYPWLKQPPGHCEKYGRAEPCPDCPWQPDGLEVPVFES